jgi:hypothetical protein
MGKRDDKCETMNRSKIFTSFRNIKNVIQKKISIWGVNKLLPTWLILIPAPLAVCT